MQQGRDSIVRCLWLVVAIAVGGGALALLGLWGGVFNVAATETHWPLTLHLIGLVRDRSIAVHVEDVTVPLLHDPERIRAGFRSYRDMCVTCHNAPGRESSVIRTGLNPSPPLLTDARVQRRGDADLFWIVKHGIRMTGMPAFGKTHTDDQLWELVAFLRYLPRMTADEYRKWADTPDPDHDQGQDGHHHVHE